MLCPDEIFKSIKHHLPTPSRRRAAGVFRRILREHAVYRAGTSRAPGMKSGNKIVIGCSLVYTGGRIRRRYKYLAPTWRTQCRGRPRNLVVEMLVSRLAHLWANACGKRTTISFKGSSQDPTQYEYFMIDVLNLLGVKNHRKYLERHSHQKRWRVTP